MDGPEVVMVAVVLSALSVPVAGVLIYLAVTRWRTQRELLLTPLMERRRRRR